MSTTVGGRSTVSRIRSTRVVPPAIYRPPRLPSANAARSSVGLLNAKGNIARASGLRRGLRDRGDNVGVRAAPADVSAHPLPNLGRRGGVLLRDTTHPGDNLARRAIAALESVLINKRPL